jgi:hypothetical protein
MNNDAVSNYYQLLNRDDRPCSLSACLSLETGKISHEKYQLFCQRRRDLETAETAMFQQLYNEEILDEKKTHKTRRGCKSLRPYYFNKDGEIVYFKPKETVWYLLYIRCPPLDDDRFAKKFCLCFRMPYAEFDSLLERVQEDELFERWTRPDTVGNPPSPIGLLLLGSLRYLGLGLTFDDLEEFTAVSEETHRQFFHRFIEYGTTKLYHQYVVMPRSSKAYTEHTTEFTVGGLNGAGHSTDATNVIMWRCEHNLKQMNTGWIQTESSCTDL